MSAPDRIYVAGEFKGPIAFRDERDCLSPHEYLRRDGETVTALVEALRRAKAFIEVPRDRAGPCLRQINAALANLETRT